MFIKSSIIALALAASTFGRILIIERDGRAIYPRRFGQEQCGGIGGRIGSACAGEICGVLGGRVPGTLLAGAGECAQQDLADDIINASKNQNAATATVMVQLAIEFRQCEKNTPPDFSQNPPALRNSVFCQKAPQNAELNGLVQAQDPNNDPELFFDPVTKTTVLRGSQANTAPFGGANNNGSGQGTTEPEPATSDAPAVTTTAAATVDATGTCPPASTVTVTVGAASTETAAATTEASATTSAAEADPSSVRADTKVTGTLSFGQCTNPAVEFGPGFDGRKLAEFSFQPENRDEFPQSSALNGQIVLNAICNILNDRCRAPQETVDACRSAITAVANVAGGAKADQFNAALGIETNFAQVPAAVGGGQGSIEAATTANFNKCEAPQIAFGIFDGRTENSFAPATPSFVHGSALNPNIITQFICDQVKDKCNANQIAIDKCEAAKAATVGLTGQAVADAFNAAISA